MSNDRANEPHTCSELPGVAAMDDVFSLEECRAIRDLHREWPGKVGTMTSEARQEESAQPSYRVCTIHQPSNEAQQESFAWCTQRLIEAIKTVNDGYYRFEVQAMIEPPTLMRYDASERGHYGYHLDIGRNRPNCWRKLSYSIFLNEDFEGGELEFLTGEDSIQHKGPVGTMVLFPSYLLHRVNVVTAGTRWAMVGWAHGGSFR